MLTIRGFIGGYVPSSVYSTKTQYRDHTYPTFSSSYLASPDVVRAASSRACRSAERENNLYNVNSNRMDCYDSGDELKMPSPGVEDFAFYPRSGASSSEIISPGAGGEYVGNVTTKSTDSLQFSLQTFSVPSVGGQSGTSERRTVTSEQYSYSNDRFVEKSSCGSVVVTQSSDSQLKATMLSSSKFEAMSSNHSAGRLTVYGEAEPPGMTVKKFQNYVEISKPFEMSDFYKYSERLRRQRLSERDSLTSPVTSPLPDVTSPLQPPYVPASASSESH